MLTPMERAKVRMAERILSYLVSIRGDTMLERFAEPKVRPLREVDYVLFAAEVVDAAREYFEADW